MADEAQTDEERKVALRKAYGQATNDLRQKYKTEFDQFYTARAAELGQEWHPKLTAAQRAAEEFDRLLVEYPFLADRLPMDTAPTPEAGAQAS